MKRSSSIIRIVVCAFAALGMIAFIPSGCSKKTGPPEKITIAYSTASNAMLMYIAFAKGFLAEEGLDAAPQPHAFGKLALAALVEGKADLATTGDTPFVFFVMNGNNIFAIATIQTSNRNEGIVARHDRGIATPADLRGKRIGVTLGTTGDFFADSFLLLNGIDRKSVKFVDMKPDSMAEALATGKVDAVSTWNPTLKQLEKGLGGNGRLFFGESAYTETFCVAASREYALKNPEAIKKVLRALIKAETFVKQHDEEARLLVAGFIKTDKAVLDETWDIFTFRVVLDQALLVDFEDQTRWILKSKAAARNDMPNYLDYIYTDGLHAVKPEAVRIVR